MELRLILPEPVNGIVTLDLRGGAPVVVPPVGTTPQPGIPLPPVPTTPPPTSGVPFLPGLPPPGTPQERVLPYPIGSQLSRYVTANGTAPFGFRFVIPLHAASGVGVFKLAGFHGECRRDSLIGINGVIRRGWWADSGYGLSTYINESFSIGLANAGVANEWQRGLTIDIYGRHPDGESFTNLFELHAAK